jgi:hypothetical protein
MSLEAAVKSLVMKFFKYTLIFYIIVHEIFYTPDSSIKGYSYDLLLKNS